MTIRVIDTETTGLSPAKGAAVIQIASIDINRELEAVNPMQTFVYAPHPVPPETSGLHGIIDSDLKGAPYFDDAVKQFAGDDMVYVAHNAQFDRDFLFPLADKPWICTMKVAKRVWPDAPNHKNQTLRYMLGLVRPFGLEREEINPHNALSDVYVTGAIFAHIIQNKLATFAQMLEWSGKPALMTTWPAGKHKGVAISKVPADYLEWVVNKSEMDADTKGAAKAELAARRVAA